MTWRPLEPSTPYRQGVAYILPDDEEMWANDLYVVHRRTMTSDKEGMPVAYHLSIRNQDRSTRHSWRDFQRIKNQLAGPEYEGIEIYPAESKLVDMANQYHLWCFPFSLGVGFETRLVGNQAQADIVAPGAKQADPEAVDLQYGGLSKIKDMKRHNQPYEEA